MPLNQSGTANIENTPRSLRIVLCSDVRVILPANNSRCMRCTTTTSHFHDPCAAQAIRPQLNFTVWSDYERNTKLCSWASYPMLRTATQDVINITVPAAAACPAIQPGSAVVIDIDATASNAPFVIVTIVTVRWHLIRV